jgi:hypothetical protein
MSILPFSFSLVTIVCLLKHACGTRVCRLPTLYRAALLHVQPFTFRACNARKAVRVLDPDRNFFLKVVLHWLGYANQNPTP